MVVLLLAAGFVNWHYVNGVGWRTFTDNSSYIRIMDGWTSTVERFIHSGNLVGSYVTPRTACAIDIQ